MNYFKKAIIVTGATSGFGFELLKSYIDEYFLIFTARDEDKAKKTLDKLSSINFSKRKPKEDLSDENNIKYFICDFESIQQVKKCAIEIVKFINLNGIKIEMIIHNAGLAKGEKSKTIDGYLSEIQVNAYSPILLNEILIKNLKLELLNGSLIVFIISSMYKKARLEYSLEIEDIYDPIISYANSKLIEIIYSKDLQQRVKELNIKIVLYSPGYLKTDFFRYKNTKRFKNIFYFIFARRPKKIINGFKKIIEIERNKVNFERINYYWLRNIKEKLKKELINKEKEEIINKKIQKILFLNNIDNLR